MRKIAVILGVLFLMILMLAGCNTQTVPAAPAPATPPAGSVPEEQPVPPQLTTGGNEETEETEVRDSAPEEATVEITASGFSPATITIPAGGRVTWINKDSTRHWPASAVHPTHEVYPQSTGACPAIGGSDFDTCKELQQGEEYSFVFTERGSWRYHDHLRPSFTGTVVVE